MSQMILRFFEKLRNVCPASMLLLAGLLCRGEVSAQEKQVVQVKTFDHQLKAMGNLELAINDKEFFAVNAKGSAFTELSQNDLPVKSVRLRNDELEAESWNYSKGVIEIIIRKKKISPRNIQRCWTVFDSACAR
jgi:hypothetical protein